MVININTIFIIVYFYYAVTVYIAHKSTTTRNIIISRFVYGKFVCCFSFIQIYNEQVSDLLHPEQQLKIKMGNDRATVEGCSVYVVKQLEDIQQLINEGEQSRKTGQTKYNELSSRSHVIATLYLSTSKH